MGGARALSRLTGSRAYEVIWGQGLGQEEDLIAGPGPFSLGVWEDTLVTGPCGHRGRPCGCCPGEPGPGALACGSELDPLHCPSSEGRPANAAPRSELSCVCGW